MPFENVEKRRIISFYFKQAHSMRTSVAHIAALMKIAQQSGNSTGNLSILQFFSQVFCRLTCCNNLSKYFSIYHSPVSLHSFYFKAGQQVIFCIDTQISSPHISCILTNKALPFFVTLPARFLVLFPSHDKKLI